MSIAVAPAFQLPDELWDRIRPFLPAEKPLRTNGRPIVPFRQVLNGIFYVLRTGCHWNAVPREFGSGSTVHRRFQEWVERGVFEALWREVLFDYDKYCGIEWRWISVDGAMTKAPLGGGRNRAEPDRPREVGNKAESSHRWRGCPSRGRRGRCQPTRQEAA